MTRRAGNSTFLVFRVSTPKLKLWSHWVDWVLLSVLDAVDLKKAKEHNQRLDEEILALRNRVRTLDSEKKVFGEVVSI